MAHKYEFPWWKYMFDKNPSTMNPSIEYKDELFNSLTRVKLYILIGFIMISIIYQIYFIIIKNKNKTKTFLNGTSETKLIFITDLSITFVFSMLSIVFLHWSRWGATKLKQQAWKVFYIGFLVATVITVFAAAQEISGFKRWSKNSEGEYKTIDDELDNQPPITNDEYEGNPFLYTLATFTMMFFFILFLTYSLKILIIIFYAFRRNNRSVTKIPKIFAHDIPPTATRNQRWSYFLIELLIICILFCIPFIVSPYVRHEKYDNIEIIVISTIIFITIILQLGFQYVGLNPL